MMTAIIVGGLGVLALNSAGLANYHIKAANMLGIVIGAAIAAVAAASVRGAPLYGLVFSWALIAINAAGGQRFPTVGWAAIGGIVLVLAVTVWQLSHKDNRRHWFGGSQARPTLT